MGTITYRKVIDLGQGSVVITLPKPWVRFHGLQAGDIVEVVTNGKLVVRPMRQRSGEGKK